jgi:hypothetical protein
VNLARLIQKDQDTFIDADGMPKKSPWRLAIPPTMTGSTKIVMRRTVTDMVGSTKMVGSLVRCLDAIEYFRLMGWFDDDWRPIADWRSIFEDVCHLTETIANLAGNAFSAWQYGAWQMALISTVGMYQKSGGPWPQLAVSEKASSSAGCAAPNGSDSIVTGADEYYSDSGSG